MKVKTADGATVTKTKRPASKAAKKGAPSKRAAPVKKTPAPASVPDPPRVRRGGSGYYDRVRRAG